MSLSLLFLGLDSFLLQPYTISRQFWVHKIQSVHQRRPFCFCLWQWRNSLRWKNGYLCPDKLSTLAIQEHLRAFSFIKTFTHLRKWCQSELYLQALKSGWRLALPLKLWLLWMLKLTFVPALGGSMWKSSEMAWKLHFHPLKRIVNFIFIEVFRKWLQESF